MAVNDSMATEPVSTIEATKLVVHILDAQNEKTDLQSVVSITGHHLDSHKMDKLLDLLTVFEDCFLGCWVIGEQSQSLAPLN